MEGISTNIMKRAISAFILGMIVFTLVGCTKKVENEKLSITVSEKQITGTYSGETEEEQASGKGIFEDNGSLSIDGEFEGGKLVSGTVKNLPYILKLNNQDYSGLYSGVYNNGANGRGEFALQNDSSQVLLEGEFREGILEEGKVSGFPITCEITGLSYSGKYTGEITHGEITGEGEFKASGVDYIGTFKGGQLEGKGELKNSIYVVDFSGISRKGKYDGETVNGRAEGNGKFTAKNSYGIKYSYEGEWKNGLYNGNGCQVFNEKSYYIENGNFKDGEYTPTPKECFNALGTRKEASYNISDKAMEFIDSNEYLFVGEKTALVLKKARQFTNNKLSYEKYKGDPSEYGNKLMKVTGRVTQVLQGKAWIYPQTDMIILDSGGNIYYTTFLTKMTNIKEGSSVTMYALPMAYFTYKNVSNQSIWSIRMAGVYIK